MMSKQVTKTNGFNIEVDDDGILVTDTSNGKTLLNFSRATVERKQQGKIHIDVFDFPWSDWIIDQFDLYIGEAVKARDNFINTVRQKGTFTAFIGPFKVKVMMDVDAIKCPFDVSVYNPNLGWKRQFINLTGHRIFSFEILNAAMFNVPETLAEFLAEDVEVSAYKFARGDNVKKATGEKVANLIATIPSEVYEAFQEYVDALHNLRIEVMTWTKGENIDHSSYRDTVYFKNMAAENSVEPSQIKQWSSREVREMIEDFVSDEILERLGVSVLE